MKSPAFRLMLSCCLLVGSLLLLAFTVDAQTVTTLARLGGDPNGYHPQAALIDGADGFLYGTTEAGGPANCGTIYKLAPDGTLATLHAFTGGGDGANPKAALLAGGDGFFYGTTASGGSGGNGTIFKMTPAGDFTVIHSFGAFTTYTRNADGAAPKAALVPGSDGFFYGTASSGGTGGKGAIFRVASDGTFGTVYSLGFYGNDGFLSTAGLTPAGDGSFYGTASGVVFRVTAAGSYHVIYRPTAGTDAPVSTLVLSGGQLYGLGYSTFVSVTTAGVLTTLHSFNNASEGTLLPFAALAAGADGNFYGSAAQGGTNNLGTVFRLTPAGGFTSLHAFAVGEGSYPAGAPVAGADGNLYGVCFNGSISQPGGSVYKMTLAGGGFNVLHTFISGGTNSVAALLQGVDGNFYGTTRQGGAKNAGTIFGVTPEGTIATVHDLDPATEGSRPLAALFQDASGTFYGTASADGPDGGGTLFQLVPAAKATSGSRSVNIQFFESKLRIIYHFSKIAHNEPISPAQAFILRSIGGRANAASSASQNAAQTTIYGVLQSGGDNADGALYSSTLDGTVTYYHQFGQGTGDGQLPEGLTEGSDGNFYGTTKIGGTAGLGTVFQLTPAGGYTTLYSFAGTGDGALPMVGLTAGSDGNLYGVTLYGTYDFATNVSGDSGTAFVITPAGVLTTLHTFPSSGADGAQPMGGLLQASDGKFYGTTSSGGANFTGTLFSMTPGGQFTSLYSFGANGGGAGNTPAAPLIQGSDGNLYGTTSAGGTDNSGVVFRVDLGLHPSFFSGEAPLSNGVYYLAFGSTPFGYYSYLSHPRYIYHFDLGYEYTFDANDGRSGVYFYDFASSTFLYTSPSFPFPYLYDFTLSTVLYYYPDPNNPGRYNTNGIRYFYRFDTGEIFSK